MPRDARLSLGLAGLSLGLVLIFFWKLAFTHLILARGDTFLYFYPAWDYRAEALRVGRVPLWSPHLFMGAPFLANPQTGVLYPLNWPLAGLPAPAAVSAAIVLHLGLAGVGALRFAQRRLGLAPGPALTAAMVFSLGGYLTAQVEHINQLQALAWFPWLLLAAGLPRPRLRLAATAAVVAMLVLAGHTQSAFIALAGLAIYDGAEAIARPWRPALTWAGARAAAEWAAPLALGLGLAAAQLAPTLELSGESLRAGGLPWREVVSFSLDPRLAGRALLPGYARSLFTEYVAYPGVIALTLGALGAALAARARRRPGLLALTVVGLAFAFGAYNPLYAGLAYLPPFDLFRVPARWLFLFAFGLAMLAGDGLTHLAEGASRRGWLALAAPLGLMALTPLAAGLTPPGETGPLGMPAAVEWAGWGLAGLAVAGLGWAPGPRRWRAAGGVLLVGAELWLASQRLPFNDLTTPEAYTSARPALTQLLLTRAHTPPERFLSMSALQFDPGDLAEMRGALSPQLPEAAVYTAIIAAKHKEVLSPNLPAAWGLHAVDGFDGGILPLRRYAEFTARFTGAPSPDGRLRENLTQTPDPELLRLINARYLITDKVNDAWVDGVFYDLQFTLTLAEGETAEIAARPALEATALGVVGEGAGAVQLTAVDGAVVTLPLTAGRVRFPAALTLARLNVRGPVTVRGLSLVDERTGAFQALTLGPYRLAHSGDVKVYEQLDVLPRAFVVTRAAFSAEAPPARVTPQSLAVITRYEAEGVEVTAEGPGMLVLTDAFYPGWEAWVDGTAAAITPAYGLFRAVPLPAGPHTVTMRYQPLAWRVGLGVTVVSCGVWGLALAWGSLTRRRRAADRARSTADAAHRSTH